MGLGLTEGSEPQPLEGDLDSVQEGTPKPGKLPNLQGVQAATAPMGLAPLPSSTEHGLPRRVPQSFGQRGLDWGRLWEPGRVAWPPGGMTVVPRPRGWQHSGLRVVSRSTLGPVCSR